MKNMYKKLCVALVTTVIAVFAQSQPPLINCQGRLFDGEKALEGNVKMIMRIFDQPTGGRQLYEDTSTVSVVDGLYSTFLGDNTTSGSLREALAAPSSWLEVTANGITFTPRERLSSVPYATMAEGIRPGGITAEMIGPQTVADSHIKDGSISGTKLAPKSVTSIHLAQNAVGTDHLADGAVTPPKLSQSYWSTSGNVTQGGTITFIGTLDGRPLDFRVSNKRALRLEPTKTSPNIVGGHEVNSTGTGVVGATISGGGAPGSPNQVKGDFASVNGGAGNLAAADRSVVGGGRENIAGGVASVVNGGFSNLVAQSYGVVGGGYGNRNEGYVATIGGGWNNIATGKVATVSGGQGNHAEGNASTVGGGWKNTAAGDAATVSGGHSNRAEGNYAAIGGGTNNFVTGDFAVVPGGSDNVASGDYSFAAGRGAKASHPGTVIFGGSQAADIVSTAPDQFLIRAKGNVGIDTTSPKEKLSVAGNVQADAFIGDGSRLSGIATTPKPGSLTDAQIAAQANIAPGKIAGTALTEKTNFQGDVTGLANNLRLKPGAIMEDHLRPGMIDEALQQSPLTTQVTQLMRDAVRRDIVVGGDVVGTLDNLQLAKGSVGSDQLDPAIAGVIKSAAQVPGLVEQMGTMRQMSEPNALHYNGDVAGSYSNLQIRAGAITDDKLAPGLIERRMNQALKTSDLATRMNKIEGSTMTAGTMFKGDIIGSANDLQIRPGSVTADKLAAGILAPFATSIAQIGESTLKKNTVYGGDLIGTADKLQIKPGSITADKLAPGLFETYLKSSDVASSMSKLAGQSITKNTVFHGDVVGTVDGLKINPEIIENAVNSSQITKQLARDIAEIKNTGIDAMKITQMIEGLQANTLQSDVVFKGDVEGPADALRLKDGSITARHLAPGAVKLEQLVIAGEFSPSQNASAELGSGKRRWKGLFLEERIDYGNRLALTSGGVVRMTVDGEGNLSVSGLRINGTPESPNIIGGHSSNKADGAVGAVIGGGGNNKQPNLVTSQYGTIGGGFGNRVLGFDSTISGGQDNLGRGTAGAIGGGFMNITDGLFASVGGGAANEATANLAAIAGGFSNKVTGAYATIPGGYQNEAVGDFSLAAGRRAAANHAGSFVWADATASTFGSTGINQFAVRASGGTHIYSNSRLNSGVKLNSGSGSWSMLSDKNHKDNLIEIDPTAVLEQLERLPVYSWNYKSQSDEIRHVGPTSQDFKQAFGIGEEDTHISSIDADGVALSAIKGLILQLREKEGQIEKLNEENSALRRRFDVVEERVNTFFEILEQLPAE
jgi:hypothetical protein